MALILCPECGQQVSAEAPACPSCGYPVAERAHSVDAQSVLMEVRPSWWNFGWHLIFFWLLIPLLVALYRRHSFVMRIYPDRVSVEDGLYGKEVREFFIKDIRSIDVKQGIWGKLVGIGDVIISTAATVDAAEEALGVSQPNRIKDLLISCRQQAKA
jgi:membrane protein YdbS with pleckstrin-like domain